MSRQGSFTFDFITSSSPEGLRGAMRENDLKGKRQYQYFDIRDYVDKRGRTKWIAWYCIETIDALKNDAEKLEGTNG
jgi:hypothetical protein